MIKRIVVAVLACWASLSWALVPDEAFKVLTLPKQFDACLQHFPERYVPFEATKEHKDKFFELCFDDFAVLYSGITKTPLFSVEHLTASKLIDAKNVQRFSEFYVDLRIPKEYRSTLEDYNKSSYDRGHLAPAGNRSNPAVMAQSFALSNIAPQDPVLNRGTWAKIESDVRSYVRRTKHDVYVYTGVLFSDKETNKTIGNKVYVPEVFYKLVYDAHPEDPRAWVYWNSNIPSSKNMKPITVEEFSKRTGMNFLLHPPAKGIND